MSGPIVLFACSTVALTSLQYLLDNERLACVVLPSMSDQGSHILEQQLAQSKIPYFRIGSQNMEANLDLLRKTRAKIGLVVTYNEILQADILNCFEAGVFNLHASTLPAYRGPVPLFWQLKDQQKETSLTLHKMTEQVDAGPIVAQKKIPIETEDTIGTLTSKVMLLTPALLDAFLKDIDSNGKGIKLTEQTGATSTQQQPGYKDVRISWAKMSSGEIDALVRACNPTFVGAHFSFKNQEFQLVEAEITHHKTFGAKPGTAIHVGSPEGFIVATADGSIKMNVIAAPEGIFSGVRLADRLYIDAGEVLT